MDLECLLVSLYVLIEDRWCRTHRTPREDLVGPPSLFDGETPTLAILAQWPRWRTERDFVRFADAHLRGYFPNLLGHSQLNRRMRALEPELRALQHDLAAMLADRLRGLPIDGHDPAPAMVRVRACRKGLFAGQATFGRSVSKTECVFSFKVGLTVSPKGVITSFGGRCVGWKIFSFSAFHSKHLR